MDIVIRATIVFFILWSLLRVIGRRELGELTPFDLVVLIVLGDLVQQGVTQEDMSITGAALAAGTICLWAVFLSELSFRWRPARRPLKGMPLVVWRDGKPVDYVMRRQRIDIDFLRDAARQQSISDLADVRCAVLEPDGLISFIKGNKGEQGDDDSAHEEPGGRSPEPTRVA